MLNIMADLRARLEATGTPAYVNIPASLPSACYIVQRTGGAWENRLIDRANVDLYAYGETEAQAYNLIQQALKVVYNLEFAQGYATVNMNVLRTDEDMSAHRPRWYANLTIHTYEKE